MVTSAGAGKQLNIIATAERIDADIKGKLHIESVQDTLTQQSQQSGGGIRVQVSLGTAWEAGGNFSQNQGSGEYQSVTRQSGLFAGEGGYHIQAGGVHLKGGVIPPFLIELMGRKSKALLLFKNRWTTIY